MTHRQRSKQKKADMVESRRLEYLICVSCQLIVGIACARHMSCTYKDDKTYITADA